MGLAVVAGDGITLDWVRGHGAGFLSAYLFGLPDDE